MPPSSLAATNFVDAEALRSASRAGVPFAWDDMLAAAKPGAVVVIRLDDGHLMCFMLDNVRVPARPPNYYPCV